MRTNAIIRILIWSVVIVILAGILVGGLTLGSFFNRFARIQQPVTEPAVVTENSPARPASVPQPDIQSGSIPLDEPEDSGSIDMGTVEGSPTAPTLLPETTVSTAPQETAAPAAISEGAQQFDASQITSISIEWVVGDIFLEPWDGDTILVSEDGFTDQKYQMVCNVRRNELDIKFCQEKQLKLFQFGGNENFTKTLRVLVPRSWIGHELDIDAASSNLELYSQSFQEVDIDGASGTCLFENCAIGELDLDTASGDVEYSGTLNSLDFDAASASFRGVLSNVPQKIDMDSMSGDLDLTLPEDAGFSAQVEGMRSNFSSDFSTTHHNGRHISGDGYCRIDVDAMSGSVYLRKHHSDAHH